MIGGEVIYLSFGNEFTCGNSLKDVMRFCCFVVVAAASATGASS